MHVTQSESTYPNFIASVYRYLQLPTATDWLHTATERLLLLLLLPTAVAATAYRCCCCDYLQPLLAITSGIRHQPLLATTSGKRAIAARSQKQSTYTHC